MSSHQISDHQLYQELLTAAPTREAASLEAFASTLTAAPQPQRSRLTHSLSRQGVIERAAGGSATRRRQRFGRRWAAALAVTACLLVVFGAQVPSALPGDGVSYAAKRSYENVQVALAFSPSSKAIACSHQMKRRANEVARLSGRPVPTPTIASLNGSILEEAAEFKEYVQESGANSGELADQRDRDVAYVVEALTYARGRTSDAGQQRILSQTIKTLTDADRTDS